MNIDNIKKIELEITSDCNAACPGCARTQNIENLKVQSLTLLDIQSWFPDRRHIENKIFKFCGVLGDPAMNTECIDMIEYLVNNGAHCQVSTNGGIQTAEWWSKLGKLSKDSGMVEVSFCVDGHETSNHIYRVNTVFKVIDRNMTAYSDAGGKGIWVYIVFDHNEFDQEIAESHAFKLGFNFATRTGMRNSFHNWVAEIGKKNNKTEVVITTTGLKEHSKKQQVKELDQFLSTARTGSSILNRVEEKHIISSITCKLIHEGEIFIASNKTLWPCCFLWDTNFWNNDNIRSKLNDYGSEWNSLDHNNIDTILQHEWFNRIIEESWNPQNDKHLKRCIRSCAYNKAYQNEVIIK
jgi:MoaA/NifB/PqqE/SkfB family radical SAM enzyme